MSEFYLSSTLMWNASLEEMINFVYENDLDGIEMWAQQWFEKGYDAEEYNRLTAVYPIKTFVHSCSWDLNMASMNEGIRRASVAEIKKSIDLACLIDAYEITVHPGHETICYMQDMYYEKMYASLKDILKYAKEKNIDVSLEIMEEIPKEFVTSYSEMMKVTKELSAQFFYTLDIAHCNSEKVIEDTLSEASRISKFHISNRTQNKLHTPLDEGIYDFTKVLKKLSEYDTPMVIEGLDTSKGYSVAKRNVEFLKKWRND